MNARRLVFATLVAVSLASALVACSRVQLAYNTADLFIELYADSYLALDRDQLASWRPTLKTLLASHREDELPFVAAFFDTAWRGALDGFSAARAGCLLDQLETIYARHARLTAALLAPLLAAARPQQLAHLEGKLRDAGPDADPRQAVERDAHEDRKRAERYAEALQSWLGSLSAEQRRIVAEVTARIPDAGEAWSAYRRAKLDELFRLLERDPDEARIQRMLDGWFVAREDLPESLSRVSDGIRAGLVELLVRLDATLSMAQREHLGRRLKALRDDFLRLQARPQLAPIPCVASRF